jgi:hypothetical protein
MNSLCDRIAKYADIDTRRAMGFPPRRLDMSQWNHIVPKGSFETFYYSILEKKLVYHEFARYDYYYTQVINNVVPVFAPEHQWVFLEHAHVKEVWYDNNITRNYSRRLPEGEMHWTAGWPEFKNILV